MDWLKQNLSPELLTSLKNSGTLNQNGLGLSYMASQPLFVPEAGEGLGGSWIDTSDQDYIMSAMYDGNISVWDREGNFKYNAPAQTSSFGDFFSDTVSNFAPIIAMAAMAYGVGALAAGAAGGGAAAGAAGAAEGAGALAAAEGAAWSGLGDVALGSGLGAGGAAGTGLQAAISTAPGYGLAATTGAPGMVAGSTSGLGMSAGGLSTAGLGTVGSSFLNSVNSALPTISNVGSAVGTGNTLSDLFKNGKTLTDLGGIAAGVGGLIQGNQNQQAQQNMIGSFLDRLDSWYAPGSNEYNLLKQEMERKDAAAGRNSQYGTRLAEMGGKIANSKMQALSGMMSPAVTGTANAVNSNSGLSQLFTGLGNAAQNGTLSKIFGAF